MSGWALGLGRSVVLAASAVLLTGCSSLLFVRAPDRRTYTDALIEFHETSFFFGSVGGSRELFIDRICLGKDIDQVVVEGTAMDIMKSVLTVGIYTPRTVKVWCQL